MHGKTFTIKKEPIPCRGLALFAVTSTNSSYPKYNSFKKLSINHIVLKHIWSGEAWREFEYYIKLHCSQTP